MKLLALTMALMLVAATTAFAHQHTEGEEGHDKEHQHTSKQIDHHHEDAHHKDHDHKAHHPEHVDAKEVEKTTTKKK